MKRFETLLTLAACFLLLSPGCTIVSINPSPDIQLRESTLCKGWDQQGENPVLLPNIVSSEEAQVCICGYLEAEDDPYLQVFWIYDGEIETHKRQFETGVFLDCTESKEGFALGNYAVEVVAGKDDLARIEFIVEE